MSQKAAAKECQNEAKVAFVHDMGGVPSGATDFRVSGASKFWHGDTIMCARTGERMNITSPPITTFQVMRGIGVSACAALDEGDHIIRLAGPPLSDFKPMAAWRVDRGDIQKMDPAVEEIERLQEENEQSRQEVENLLKRFDAYKQSTQETVQEANEIVDRGEQHKSRFWWGALAMELLWALSVVCGG